MTRAWAMPSGKTFTIKPIKEFIERNVEGFDAIADPFSNGSKYGTITNDLDPAFNTTYNMDALDFLKMLPSNSMDCVLYDPPYSARQVAECYKKFGKTVNMETTQSSYWSKQKQEISRITKVGGVVLSFGWNSQGVGASRGFQIEEILLVAHGGAHNDTICVKERKIEDTYPFG